MSQTRLQDEYNKIITECDIVVSLFKTKVGQYTEEEVMKAYETFKKNNKPLIYTYFKEAQIDVSTVNLENLQSLQDFKNKLSDLGHFYTTYKNIEDLKFQFSQQLIKLIPTLTNIQDEAEVKTVPTEENLGKKSKSGNTRLEKKLEMLNEQWEIASEILQELNKALVIEADVMRKFQLQKQIEDRENELDQLEKEIEEIENRLE